MSVRPSGSWMVDQVFVPGLGWFDIHPKPLRALIHSQAYVHATAFRIVGRGDYLRREVAQ